MNKEEKLERYMELYFLAEKAERRLSIIDHEVDYLMDDLAVLKTKMDKEHEDVIKLERMSKYKLFMSILKDREQELERERQEYLRAVLDYNAVAKEIELLEYEKSLLIKKAEGKGELKKQRDYLLKIKEQKILYTGGEHSSAIKKIRNNIDVATSLIREIKEAEAVLLEAEKEIKKAIYFLNIIDDKFGFYEFEAGLMLTYSNKKYLKKAIDHAIKVKILIQKMDKELSDVYEKYELPKVYKYDQFIKVFHANLVADWVLKNKLNTARKALVDGQGTIAKLFIRLESDRNQANKKLSLLVDEKQMYVLNS